MALFNAVLSLAAGLCLWSTSSFAAKISLSPLGDDPASALVTLEGDLEAGDQNKFRTQVGRLTKAFVVFNSDGGNLLAGIEIGKTIRLKSFATVVLGWSAMRLLVCVCVVGRVTSLYGTRRTNWLPCRLH